MKDLYQSILRDVVAQYGRGVCDSPERLKGLLQERLGKHPGSHHQRLNVILLALRDNVPRSLLASAGQFPPDVLRRRLVAQLQANPALTEQDACWAVTAWGFALGLWGEEAGAGAAPAPGGPPRAEKEAQAKNQLLASYPGLKARLEGRLPTPSANAGQGVHLSGTAAPARPPAGVPAARPPGKKGLPPWLNGKVVCLSLVVFLLLAFALYRFGSGRRTDPRPNPVVGPVALAPERPLVTETPLRRPEPAPVPAVVDYQPAASPAVAPAPEPAPAPVAPEPPLRTPEQAPPPVVVQAPPVPAPAPPAPPAPPPPPPPPARFELAEAQAQGRVRFTASGRDLGTVTLHLTSTSPEYQEIVIPPGTVFESTVAGKQSMVVRESRTVTLVRQDSFSAVTLSAACVEMPLDTPKAGDALTLRDRPAPADLQKLLGLPEFRNEGFRCQQFAIWTITDDPATPADFVGISTGYLGVDDGGPTASEMDRMRHLFARAGIDQGKYRALR